MIVNLETVDVEAWIQNPNNIYIGRKKKRAFLKASKWENPYPISRTNSRKKVIKLFEQYIRSNDILLKDLNQLRNKNLGCWCHPKPCHGDILKQLLRENTAVSLTMANTRDSVTSSDNAPVQGNELEDELEDEDSDVFLDVASTVNGAAPGPSEDTPNMVEVLTQEIASSAEDTPMSDEESPATVQKLTQDVASADNAAPSPTEDPGLIPTEDDPPLVDVLTQEVDTPDDFDTLPAGDNPPLIEAPNQGDVMIDGGLPVPAEVTPLTVEVINQDAPPVEENALSPNEEPAVTPIEDEPPAVNVPTQEVATTDESDLVSTEDHRPQVEPPNQEVVTANPTAPAPAKEQPSTDQVLTQEVATVVEVVPDPATSPVDTGTSSMDNTSNDGESLSNALHSPFDTVIPIIVQADTPENETTEPGGVMEPFDVLTQEIFEMDSGATSRKICNPFDLDIPFEEVLNSLEKDEVDELDGSPILENEGSSSRTLRPQRNSIQTTALTDEGKNADDHSDSHVLKSRPIEEEKELFLELSAKPCRGKGAQLKDEEPTTGVYKTKCGFRTSRPLLWATALEKLVKDCRWDYLLQDDKYSTAFVKIINSGGMIIVEIRFATGVILVEGSSHEEWLDGIFERWSKLAIEGEFTPAPVCAVVTTTTKAGTGDMDLHHDVESLWQAHNSLKNAFTTLDSTVNKLSDDIQDMLKAINDLRTAQETMSKVTLSKDDDKIQTFLKTASDECVGNVSKCKVEMKAEIEKQKTLLIKQEGRFQSITDQLKNQVQNIQSPEASSVKWTHLENIRMNCSNTYSNLDNQLHLIQDQVEKVVAKVEASKTTSTGPDEMVKRHDSVIQAQQIQINELARKMKSLPVVAAPSPSPIVTTNAAPSPQHAVPRPTPTIYQQSGEQQTRQTPSLAASSNQGNDPVSTTGSVPPQPPSSHTPVDHHPPNNKEVKLVVWTDSNGKYLKPGKLWKREGTQFERTAMIKDISRTLDINRNTKIGCILISCGVNDIETSPGEEVAKGLIGIVRRVQQEHPSTKIVLSEVTPYHNRDHDVRTCNSILHRELSNSVHLVSLDSLQDDDWSNFRDDRKHIKESSIRLFASLLIDALRLAHGLPARNRSNNAFQRRQPQKPPPQPLMSVPIHHQPYFENRSRIPIGRRLQSIADGENLSLGPKHEIMSKLTDLMKCLQRW